ncbi:MAG TPA: site-specific integrase [Lactobacillaceae bacterium]
MTKYTKERRDGHIAWYDKGGQKRWRVRMVLSAHGQSKEFKKSGFESFAEASQWKQSQVQWFESNNGVIANYTFNSYWLIYSRRKVNVGNWRETSFETTQRNLKHVLEKFGDRELNSLNRGEYQDWLIELSNEHDYTRKTNFIRHSAFMSMLDEAVLDGALVANRLKKIDIPGRPSRQIEMSESDFKKIIRTAVEILKPQDLLRVRLASMGLRRGEVTAIRIGSYKNSRLTIRQQITSKNRLQPVKTAKANRTIPLPPDICDLFEQVIGITRQIYKDNAIIPNDESWLFVNKHAVVRPYSSLYELFKRIRRHSGVYVYPHLMRHALATFALDQSTGLNPRDVANYLGHTTIQMSMDYNSGTPEGQERVANIYSRF